MASPKMERCRKGRLAWHSGIADLQLSISECCLALWRVFPISGAFCQSGVNFCQSDFVFVVSGDVRMDW